MKNKIFLHRILLAVWMVLCLVLTGIQPVSGQAGTRVFISEIDCSAFPTITLLIRGLDDSGSIISADLLANNFVLYENNKKVETIKPIGSVEGPKYVVFSFDLGKISNLQDYAAPVEEGLLLFANEYFRDGRDTVQLVTHTNPGTQKLDATPPTTSLLDFEAAIENLDLGPSEHQLEGFLGLNNLYNRLAALDPGRFNMVIIHFSRMVEGIPPSRALSDAQTLGNKMASKDIQVYVLITDTRGALNAAPPFQALATQSRGVSFDFSNAPLRESHLNEIFNQIKLNAQTYRLQFQAQELNASYSVAPSGVSATDATDRQTCPDKIELAAPVVAFTQPSGENPTEFLSNDQGSVTVKASLQDWPRDGSRRIVRAELIVNDVMESFEDFPPESPRTSFTFNVDLSDRQISDTTALKLQVRVFDQFGGEGSAETNLTLFPYIAPTATPRAPTVAAVSPICQDNPYTPECILQWLQANMVWILLALMLVIIVVLFRTNRRLANMAAPARQAISKGFDQVRKTILGGMSSRQTPIATLHVLVAREDRTGGKIEIYNNRTTLGRDPKVTDIQLYGLEDQSSVSSLHCTIFYEQGKFFITDDNSTNGTYVNGKRLDPNEPVEIPDDSEIILGDIYRQGAKLRFEIAKKAIEEEEELQEELEDFHVDIPQEGAPLGEPAPNGAKDDERKTIPGYRVEDESSNSTEVFFEPPPASAPPVPAAKPAPSKPVPAGKKDNKKDWKDELG